MNGMREKLIAMLITVHDKYGCHLVGTVLAMYLADHLIANGVTIPVRCKDCWKSAEGLCSYQFKNVPGKDFCGDGERITDG